MEFTAIFIVLTTLVLSFHVQGVLGAEDPLLVNAQSWTVSVFVVVGAIVGMVIVVVVCAGNKKVNPNIRTAGPPDWTRSLVFNQDLAGGFNAVSDGMKNLSPFHVMRERLGVTVTDAARWCEGLKEGKHVFEVYWPAKKNRGFCSCIGLGSADVPLKKQGRVSLIGEHSQSWGLDLAKRRAIHFNKVQQRLYLGVPDRFFMYVDMDAGKVGFGGDIVAGGAATEFFGYILTGIPKNTANPMYVMVSSCMPNEQIQVYYRGTHTPFGGYDLLTSQSPMQPPSQQVVYHITTEHHYHVTPDRKQKKKHNSSSSSSSDTEPQSEKPHKKKGAEKY